MTTTSICNTDLNGIYDSSALYWQFAGQSAQQTSRHWYGLLRRLPNYLQKVDEIRSQWMNAAKSLNVHTDDLDGKWTAVLQMRRDDLEALPSLASRSQGPTADELLETREFRGLMAAHHADLQAQLLWRSRYCNQLIERVVKASVEKAVEQSLGDSRLAYRTGEIQQNAAVLLQGFSKMSRGPVVQMNAVAREKLLALALYKIEIDQWLQKDGHQYDGISSCGEAQRISHSHYWGHA